MMRRIFFFIAWVIALPLLAQPLPEKVVFESVPVPGTIQSALTEDILQDPHGMLWVAKDILYRYNGRVFREYNTIFPDSVAFNRREITRLLWDDHHHRLLVGTRNHGLLQYRYETDRLEKIPGKEGTPIINDIAQTDDGTVWVTSFSSGFFQVHDDTLRKWDQLSDVFNPLAALAKGNELWVGSVSHVVVIREGKVVRKIPLSDYANSSPATIRANSLMFDTSGQLWIGTERDGLIAIDTTSFRVIKNFSPQRAPFYNAITELFQDNQGVIWILTKGDGLIVYSPEENKTLHVIRSESEKGSLSGDFCTSICQDASGIIWIGASGDLNKYDRHRIKFEHYAHNPSDPNSLSDDNIRNVFEDEDGTIYLATSGGFINSLNREKNSVDHVKVVVRGLDGFISPFCITSLDKQSLLVSTSAGVLQFNKSAKTFSLFKPIEKLTRNFPVRQVIRNGDTYYFTLRGSVVRYDSRTKETITYGKELGIRNSTSLAVDSENRLWVGTHQGILYSDPEQKKFTFLNLERDLIRPDSSYFLTLSMQQIRDKLWINTFNHAIYIVDLTKTPIEVIDRITAEDGLPDQTIYASIPDKKGSVWITHNNGLSQYQLHSKKFINYSVSEGLQDEEFNRLAFFQSKTGEIILGGINGINIFHPEKIEPPQPNLDIQLVGLTIFGNTTNQQHYSLIHRPEKIELHHGQNSFHVEFFVPDFQEPVRYTLQYKLEPLNDSWVETKDFVSSNYANLSPGSYLFHVRAKAETGEEKTVSAEITILPPYWKTWWFIGLVTIIVAFFIYTIIYARVQSAHRETERLGMLLKIRTQEIERSREELENLNRKKDLIFSILSHDLRSPLTTLKGFLGLLIDNSEALTKEDIRKYATTIRNSVTNSLDLIDNTLFWSLSQTGNIQCSPSSVPVAFIFEKIKGLYQLTAEKKRINLVVNHVDGLAVYADENMMYVLLRNLISNALKFTPEGKDISIDAMQQGALVAIRVKDQGIGMTPDEIDKIFELDNPVVKKGTSSEKGTGLGLLLCKKFVELNKGKLLIESEEGIGSQFTVILPKA